VTVVLFIFVDVVVAASETNDELVEGN